MMDLGRRAFLRALVGSVAAVSGFFRWSGRARAATIASSPLLSVRGAQASDGTHLRAIMMSCVADERAFFGKCGDWPLAWAQELIASKPDTVVLSRARTPVAFHEVPPMQPLAALPADASEEEKLRYARRDASRRIFRVSAAGVRDDLLSPAEAAAAFRAVIYAAYVQALKLGYTHAEALAPWEQHPRLEKKWTDYPGLELVQPPAKAQEGGHDVYWLRWRLEDAVIALAAEGATASLEVQP